MLSLKLHDDYLAFSQKLKQYVSLFNPSVILDSCLLHPQFFKGNYKIIASFGGDKILEPANNSIELLDKIYSEKCWYFGILGYNLKNEIEKLKSENDKCFGWSDIMFFKPETVITVDFENNLIIYGANAEYHFDKINSTQINDKFDISNRKLIHPEINKSEYISKVNSIKNEIIKGNVYELNLCERFLYQDIELKSPISFYENLVKNSPTPFSAYFAIHNKYVMSASPERFLYKIKNKLISQPIKGTIARDENLEVDIENKNSLKNSVKEMAENVMIVDLVRNDLSKVSVAGSVKVEELFGIYSYSQVHQMVSTISSQLKAKVDLKEIISSTFPMGSMTGTPKIAAMQLIEISENFDREWYSGALGYITPWEDFDFNVLIRTAFYDSYLKKIAYYSGGAITIDSDAKEELKEILVKTEAIKKLIK
ncbi:MAG: anthranilate synthase component I family protein [Bacteroidia bacterium]|nr:anthranilate synthase component I family protein [Bacteroidia bacterium]